MTHPEIAALQSGDQITVKVHSCPAKVITIAEITVVPGHPDVLLVVGQDGSRDEYAIEEIL